MRTILFFFLLKMSHPLPSLCSSISSYNSTKSICDDTILPNNRKRWDDSQFAIDLCDDGYKSISSQSATSLKEKLKSSKLLFHQTDKISVKISLLLRKIKSIKSL